MRVRLAQQAQEILGQSDLVIITERVDDVALLIGQMVKMGLPEVLDRHTPHHGTERGLSWGWTAVIWLAYIITEGDHRKVSVETYLKGMHHTLSHLTAQVIEPLDFSDDRLSHLLQHLSKPAYWHQIEHDLNARSIEVYPLPQDVIRCDATTVSGYHEVTTGGLVQFGHSKDDPTRPQIKVRSCTSSGAWQKYSYRRQYGIMRSRNGSLLLKGCSYVYHRFAVPRHSPRDTADRTTTGLFGAACPPSDESPAPGAPRQDSVGAGDGSQPVPRDAPDAPQSWDGARVAQAVAHLRPQAGAGGSRRGQ